MKITKATIENNNLTIILDSANDVQKVYLDDITNFSNIHSDDDSEHTHVITEGLGNQDTFTIDISAITNKAYIVTVVTETKVNALAIDNESLYYSKVRMIENLYTLCKTCPTKCQKEKIIISELRSNLLDYAIQNNMTDDAIRHYIDLDRILNDSINNNICCL